MSPFVIDIYSAVKSVICISEKGHYLNLIVTATRGGYDAVLETRYIDTSGMCLELFFWPITEASSVHRSTISVLTVTEEKTINEWASSSGYELEMWNRLFAKLPDGIHQVMVVGHRSASGRSGMSIDDIVVQPCVNFGNIHNI